MQDVIGPDYTFFGYVVAECSTAAPADAPMTLPVMSVARGAGEAGMAAGMPMKSQPDNSVFDENPCLHSK